MYKCGYCGNTEEFIASYVLEGECIVDGDGSELEGIDTLAINEFIYSEVTTEIHDPYKCAKCGGTNVYWDDED